MEGLKKRSHSSKIPLPKAEHRQKKVKSHQTVCQFTIMVSRDDVTSESRLTWLWQVGFCCLFDELGCHVYH